MGYQYLEPPEDGRVLYSFHMYEPYDYTTYRLNQGRYSYPGPVRIGDLGRDQQYDRQALDSFLDPVREWARRYQVPVNRIFAGEFGCDRRNRGAAQYLADLVDLFDRDGWHWAFYTYRPDAWQGMDYELGAGEAPSAYWQARNAGNLSERYRQIYGPRSGNPLWTVLEREFNAR